jgi:Uma2 family endonuclease
VGAAAGVRHVWLVDARYRMLEVLRLHDRNWLRIGVFHDDDKVRAEPFEAVELELAGLWAKLEDEIPPTRALEAPATYVP